jgi:hypothetical protein
MYDLMNTVIEIIKKLRNEHFIYDFEVKKERIISKDTNESFAPEDLIIENTYRYEGDSNPSDNAVVYAITAKSGTMGILIDSFGVYADPELAEVVGNIPVREEYELKAGGNGKYK